MLCRTYLRLDWRDIQRRRPGEVPAVAFDAVASMSTVGSIASGPVWEDDQLLASVTASPARGVDELGGS